MKKQLEIDYAFGYVYDKSKLIVMYPAGTNIMDLDEYEMEVEVAFLEDGIEAAFEENDIKSVSLILNNAIKVGDKTICGTRGWFYDESEDTKVRKREVMRLTRSLEMAESLGGEKAVFLHYPPVYGEYVCNDILDVLKQYNIKTVYHGHIHGAGFNNAVKEFEGVEFKLISCDCIDFTPVLVAK